MVAEMEAALEALNQGLQDAMDEQARVLRESEPTVFAFQLQLYHPDRGLHIFDAFRHSDILTF